MNVPDNRILVVGEERPGQAVGIGEDAGEDDERSTPAKALPAGTGSQVGRRADAGGRRLRLRSGEPRRSGGGGTAPRYGRSFSFLASVLLCSPGGGNMILFLVLLLVALWLLGMVTSTTLGGALHILLVIAVIFLLIRVIRGQPV